MFKRPLPPLALALASAASADPKCFRDAVSEMERADRDYRRAIEKTLPRESAQRMLSSMDSFRERVRAVRENARTQIAEIYGRYGRTYGLLDPLDPSTPFAAGLSHVDGTRVAGIADNARSQVDALRAQINEALMQHLQAQHVETLIAAKRARQSAFEKTIKRALERTGMPAEPKTVYRLAELAEGWY